MGKFQNILKELRTSHNLTQDGLAKKLKISRSTVGMYEKDIYTTNQILETLRSMQMTLLNTSSGYIPSYTRTELTDALHKTFDFRTDYELITKASMRTLIKDTKQIKSKQK